MVRTACSAMLFDLDGVLIDSTPAVSRVWTKWALRHGFDPKEVVLAARGRPSLTTIREYLPAADHQLENSVVERGEIEDLEGVVAFPGVRELLDGLPSKRWTIVTSCTRRLAEARLRAAGLVIPEKIVTSSDVQNGKPHPEPYLKAATKLGFPANECVVVEDAPAGVLAGKAAGARVAAVLTTSVEGELQSAGADWIVQSSASISFAGTSAAGKLELVLAAQFS